MTARPAVGQANYPSPQEFDDEDDEDERPPARSNRPEDAASNPEASEVVGGELLLARVEKGRYAKENFQEAIVNTSVPF